MLAANLIAIVLACSIGLVVAVLLLPIYDSHALARYWWALLALPGLLALLHPKALPGVVDRAFGLIGRPPLGERLNSRSELKALLWSILAWVGLGAHLAILAVAVGRPGLSTVVLSIGGMALAVSLGVLFIPAPAGAGIRDVVLALVLSRVMTSGQALAVVVTSRMILIGCDLFIAAIVGLARRPSAPRV
jgi:uncharacterized membrane protein YbhN (UPF0104 family)